MAWGLTFLGRGRISDNIEPSLGLSFKLYLLDTVTIEGTRLIKLDMNNLDHYEAGIRLYIHRLIGRIDGRWYLGNRNVTTIQVGLGYTF